jgi:hypothetical protein
MTPTPAPTSIIDGAQVLQMLLAVGGVGAALRWGMPWAIKKFGRGRTASEGGAGIELESSTGIGAASLHIVAIEGRRFLAEATPQSVSLVAELSEAAAAPTEPAFFDHLDAVMDREEVSAPMPGPAPTHAVIEVEAPAEPAAPQARRKEDPDEAAREALRRLDQLFGPER